MQRLVHHHVIHRRDFKCFKPKEQTTMRKYAFCGPNQLGQNSIAVIMDCSHE